ncbi:MAG TPA: dihydrolipoamide acetyltransferase family protein, partial [Terracidiphilus sp.]|nr:dihydrolipoamide acetyltransferase family protein [Terracidiphilus sp.]
MPTDVTMPQMGESIFEGTITRWLKKAGDPIEKDEPLFEISTDKVDAEIPSTASGVVREIRFPEGATVQVNTVVAVIADSVDASAGSTVAPSAASVQSPVSQAPAESASVPAEKPADSNVRQPRYSPLVRRLAKDNELDLESIEGTGVDGRITKEDVLRHMEDREARSAQPAIPTSSKAPASTAAPRPPSAKSDSTPAAQLSASAPPPPLRGELVPLSKMRALIAQRMTESSQNAPHVHTVFKVDMTHIVRLREREKAGFEQRNGVKLTYMPFVAVAAMETLRKFPIVNASMEGTAIRYHESINLGIAVALDWGLIVPVIKQAEERNFLGLARAIADLAERARGKRLKPDEVSGSTFTLTNSGIFGEEFGTPIINQPDSAILAIGGLKKEP